MEWSLVKEWFILIWVLGVKQNLIPYMWQMVLANILVKGWTIDPNVYWLFHRSSKILVLPTHYNEIMNCCGMACDVAVVIYIGEGALRCSLNLST